MDRMHRRNSNPKSYTSYAFDSVWAAALLFQKSLSYPKFRPDNVEFKDIEARNFYAWALSKTQFEGLTVRLKLPSTFFPIYTWELTSDFKFLRLENLISIV
jgi:hypothetical protein